MVPYDDDDGGHTAVAIDSNNSRLSRYDFCEGAHLCLNI
jgi:hypothetical protein